MGSLRLDFAKIRRYPAPLRLAIFTTTLLAVWLPFSLPLRIWLPDANAASIVSLVILYAEFLVLVRLWGQRVYRQPYLLWLYGLEFSRRNGLEVLLGLGIGLTSVLMLFITQGWLGWLSWQNLHWGIVRTAIEGGVVALAIGFAEEVLFRGWLLDELRRDYTPNMVLVASAVLFATLHFRLLAFPAYVLLGLTLVWAKRACYSHNASRVHERLGLPIGLHAGLVWGNYVVEVGQMINHTDRVSPWLTGVGGNPLTGLLGLVFLAGMAIAMRQFAHIQQAKLKW